MSRVHVFLSSIFKKHVYSLHDMLDSMLKELGTIINSTLLINLKCKQAHRVRKRDHGEDTAFQNSSEKKIWSHWNLRINCLLRKLINEQNQWESFFSYLDQKTTYIYSLHGTKSPFYETDSFFLFWKRWLIKIQFHKCHIVVSYFNNCLTCFLPSSELSS